MPYATNMMMNWMDLGDDIGKLVLSYLPFNDRNMETVHEREILEQMFSTYGKSTTRIVLEVADKFNCRAIVGGKAVDLLYGLGPRPDTDFDLIIERTGEHTAEMAEHSLAYREFLQGLFDEEWAEIRFPGVVFRTDSKDNYPDRRYKITYKDVKIDLIICSDLHTCLMNFDIDICRAYLDLREKRMGVWRTRKQRFRFNERKVSLTGTFLSDKWERFDRASPSVAKTMNRLIKYGQRGFEITGASKALLNYWLSTDFGNGESSEDED